MTVFSLPRSSIAATLLACAVLCCPVHASAQDAPGNVRFGMTAEELNDAVPGLKKMAHPVRLGGGLVGSWSGPSVLIAGTRFSPTYFFGGGTLKRVEYLATPPEPASAFDAVRAWGRAQWGPDLESQGPEGTYTTWSAQDLDVYLQATGPSQGAPLRLVVKSRVLKDGSEL